LPARRSTFGTAGARGETAALSSVLRRLALAAPHVRLALHGEDRIVLQTTGSGNLATTLGEVYGQELLDFLTPFGPLDCQGASVSGAVTGADMTRPGRSGVTILVNGRPVNGKGLQSALEASYRPLLPRGRHPVLVLAIGIDTRRVDVNVHPGKLEVRLRGERAIAAGAAELVRDSLGRRPLTLRWEPLTGADALRRDAANAVNEDAPVWDDAALIVTPELPPLRLIGQVAARLLLLEGEAGVYLIDQHRAHERILYERMRAAAPIHGERSSEPVLLPDPLLIELPHSAELPLGRRLGELRGLGFEIEDFGGRSFLLRSAPPLPGVLAASADAQSLRDLADPALLAPALVAAAEEAEIAGDGETWQERLLVRLACRTAVRRGRVLDRPLMRALVEGLGQTATPAVCPHGSPLLMHVDARALEREFGW
jgi:DNA mismatch repair protein MutL